MRQTLLFRHGEQGRVPAIGLQPVRIVDGKTRVIADVGATAAMRLIFVGDSSPFPGEIYLRKRGAALQEHGGHCAEHHELPTRCRTHTLLPSLLISRRGPATAAPLPTASDETF